MILYTKVLVDVPHTVSCDSCKEIWMADESDCINLTGSFSYGSRKDGDIFEVDLCSNCAETILGKYWRIKNV